MKITAYASCFIEDQESELDQMRDVSELLSITSGSIDGIDEYGSYNSRENGTWYANCR